jgi:hypothetical protein
VSHYGPSLANAFIRQVTGLASRLDLSDFAVTIRQFLKRDPRAKVWMQQALAANVPVEKADEVAQRAFIQRIALYVGVVLKQGICANHKYRARDHRTMKEVLTQFWSACLGMSSQYKPL